MNKIVLIFITIGWVIAVQPMQNNGYCKTKDSLDKMRIENLCNNINDVTNDGPLKGDTKRKRASNSNDEDAFKLKFYKIDVTKRKRASCAGRRVYRLPISSKVVSITKRREADAFIAARVIALKNNWDKFLERVPQELVQEIDQYKKAKRNDCPICGRILKSNKKNDHIGHLAAHVEFFQENIGRKHQ